MAKKKDCVNCGNKIVNGVQMVSKLVHMTMKGSPSKKTRPVTIMVPAEPEVVEEPVVEEPVVEEPVVEPLQYGDYFTNE